MTDERKQELRKLCEAATAGPWLKLFYTDGREQQVIMSKHADGGIGFHLGEMNSSRDRTFVIASRDALPELLTALDAAEAKLEQVRLIIAPNEASPDIVRAAQRIIDTCFVEIEQANKVHAKNVDLSDKLRATRAQVAALAGQVADWRAGLEEIAEGRGAFSSDQLEFAVNVIEAAKARAVEMLARPTAIERKVTAALALAEALSGLLTDPDYRMGEIATEAEREHMDKIEGAHKAYLAATEAENV